jgi:UDP-3-O-[3-hydroxymyristoyl] glucosamine N-acyltransferase
VDHTQAWVESSVRVGGDTVLWPGVVLTGRTRIGRGVRVGAGVVLRDTVVGDGATLGPHAVLQRVRVRAGERVAPGTVQGAITDNEIPAETRRTAARLRRSAPSGAKRHGKEG